jgi:phosphate starvation-inducible membrane PsiE
MAINKMSTLSDQAEEFIENFGDLLVRVFHLLALFAIGATIVWAAVVAFSGMVENGHATVEDILLLFIYLELGAMVGIYFNTNHMPVRFLIYVAITALTRLLISMVFVEHNPDLRIVIVTGGILLLSVGVLILRIGSYKYPSSNADDETDLEDQDREA